MISNLWRLLRPKQWTKNLIVFAGLIFSHNLFERGLWFRSLMAFILFCLLSSSIYVFNDLIDLEQDRCHPEKAKRPLPSGQVTKVQASVLHGVLVTGALVGSFGLGARFMLVALGYLGLMFLYTFWLKRLVLVDVLVIAMGFVLRAVAGTTVIDVPVSPWLLVCTILLALFLGFAKRRHELVLLASSAAAHRTNLGEYTPALLDQLTAIVTAATIMAYCLYTLSAGNSPYLMLTIPLVLYGLFRYLYLVQCRAQGGSPEMVLLSDRPLLVDVGLWAIAITWLTYYGRV